MTSHSDANGPANLGELLLKAGVISPDQLRAAVEHQERSGDDLAQALFALGFISDRVFAKLLARRYDLPWIDLDRHKADPAVVRLLPAPTAIRFEVFPLALDRRVLSLAMADPTNVGALDDIGFMTGCRVEPVVASRSALKAAIDRCYGSSRSEGPLTEGVVGDSGDVTGPTPGVDDVATVEGQAQESGHVNFVQPSTPVVWTLVTVNTFVFGLELLWGGSDWGPTLHRMGAGLGRAGMAHEPWRIVSAAFVHVNIVHLALNMWALVVFGRLLEVMLGTHRFVVLYAFSAAGGGLASSLVHAQILSAGASGAVWGLMTAQIALMLRLKWLHGAQQVPVRTWLLLQPLVVNLLISLLPFIDLAAHLGGGVVGAGLILSGLMWGPRPAPAWRPAAGVAALAMAACLTVALAQGRPWELRWPPPLVPRAIAGTSITVPVPRGLNVRPPREEDVTAIGDLALDPLAVTCWVKTRETALSVQQRPEYLARVAQGWAAEPLKEGESWESPPRVVQLPARPAVSLAFRYASGSVNRMWVMVEGRWWVQLEVVTTPDTPASWAGLPAAIAGGVAFRPEKP